MMNPMQIMNAMVNGKNLNPLSMIMGQLNNNPVFNQAKQMAQGKSPEELKQTCENICKQKGINFDDAWKQFQSQISGLK